MYCASAMPTKAKERYGMTGVGPKRNRLPKMLAALQLGAYASSL